MTSLIRIFTLLACFFLDVHVRAEPIDARFAKKTYRHSGLLIVLEKGSVAEVREGFHLVRGQVLVGAEDEEAEIEADVRTPFASIRCSGHCLALIERTKDRVSVRNLSGDWQVQRVGDTQVYALKEAMQLRVSQVGTDGVAEMEFPQSLPWLATVKSWRRLYPGESAAFKKDVAEFRERWKAAVEEASEMHAEGAKRTLASHEAEVARQAAERQALERENASLRRLFREKTGFE